MAKLTKKEIEIMNDLQTAMAKSMQSKPTLAVLSSLVSKGMIEWDPFAGTAKLTPSGEQHLC
jgi:hypothetical protein